MVNGHSGGWNDIVSYDFKSDSYDKSFHAKKRF